MATEDKTKQELQEETHALQNVIDTLRREKAETERKYEELRLIHLRRESSTSQLNQENDRLKANNDNLVIANSTLRHNVAAMNTNVDQWAAYASQGTDQLSKLNVYTDDIERRLKSKEAEIAQLKASLKDLRGCNNKLVERHEDLEERLVTKKIKAQALQAEHDELQRKHEALWRTVHYLDQIVEEDQNEVMRMRHGVLRLKKLWESYEQQ